MNERDMEYLGNINTSPGPGAGKSIDPTKPGPDDLLTKEVKDAWHRYYHEAPIDFDPVAEEIFEAGWKAALARSDAEPVKYEYRWHEGMDWTECGKAGYNAFPKYEYRALYTAPPRPDASAGLIEDLLWRLVDDARYMRNATDYEFESRELARRYAQKIAAPDASARLIEAAEILETDSHYSGTNARRWLQEAANILRARAANRSGK